MLIAACRKAAKLITRSEFEPLWDGRIILIEQDRARSRSVLRRFGARDAAHRVCRRLFGRFLPARTRPKTATGIVPAECRTAAGPPIIDFVERARKAGRAISLRNGSADERRRADELAFLPAALEVAETPPSPLGRAVALQHHRGVRNRD